MTLAYITFINLLLLTRLSYLTRDGGLTLAAQARIGLAQALLVFLCFQLNALLLVTLLLIVSCSGLAAWLEPKLDLAKGYRLLSLPLLVLAPGYLGSLIGGFEFNGPTKLLASHLSVTIPFIQEINVARFFQISVAFAGLLLLANETNIAIRAVFHHLGLEPQTTGKALPGGTTEESDSGTLDRQEYNAGRVIGILERWLMYVIILAAADLAALAFIIAAKGLARFEQLKDRQFAEYMLVGTLLSAHCCRRWRRLLQGSGCACYWSNLELVTDMRKQAV